MNLLGGLDKKCATQRKHYKVLELAYGNMKERRHRQS